MVSRKLTYNSNNFECLMLGKLNALVADAIIIIYIAPVGMHILCITLRHNSQKHPIYLIKLEFCFYY